MVTIKTDSGNGEEHDPSTAYEYLPTQQSSEEPDNDEETKDDSNDKTCVECGHGKGSYPDDALDTFTETENEEPIHYGCRRNGSI